MVNPVTGPFRKVIDTPSYFLDRTWFRQRRPYNLPLTFTSSIGSVHWSSDTDPPGDAWRVAYFARTGNFELSYNKAYANLVDKLGDPAGLGVTLGQWRQADDMIRRRGDQLVNFTKNVVRRNPIGAAAALGISAERARRIMSTRYGVAKSLSDLWLEFWFGWKPLVSDIYTACEVFDRDLPWSRYTGTGTVVEVENQDGLTPYSEFLQIGRSIKTKIGVDVRVRNPNVRLLQQFGLINPALVAFDMVPWSFVLDWVVNCQQWLSSFTDFAGLETSGGYVTRFSVAGSRGWWPAYPFWGFSGSGAFMSRETFSEVPRPTLTLKGWSMRPTRGLTAISLLAQQLAGLKR